MSCDQTRINNIETNLKTSPNEISTNDLIYYLQCNTNNNQLDSSNLTNTEAYLRKINNSFFYENIFVNTSNYGSIVPLIIGLLIPFYYFYPRFYKLGFIGTSIGLISLMGIYTTLTGLYSNFFSKVGILFLILTLGIYVIFFIGLNKLNHISLFFISAIIAYLIVNYICRIILTLPSKSNIYNQYNATLNNNKNYTQYNILLETTCYQIINRYNLKLPSGVMLYSYLTEFTIGNNTNTISDFLTNLLGPLVSIGILFILGTMFSLFKDTTILNKVNELQIFPIIGINENSDKYFMCQANYILPKELNVNLLIHELVDKYNFDEKVYHKVEKALLRISKELLLKYNPKFIKSENKDKKFILDNLKNNKIYLEIVKILKKNNFEFNINYLDEIKEIVKNEEIPYKTKEEIYDLLLHIDNVLVVINEKDEKYDGDYNKNLGYMLAQEVLLYDKDIDEEFKETLKNISEKYIKNFTDNLNLKDGILFGYDYNISGYTLFNNKTREYSNIVFKYILRFLSSWLLLAKPIGSTWLVIKYILISSYGFKKLLRNMSNGSFLWKYFSMGIDTSYFEEAYKELKNNNQNSIISKGLNLLYSVLLFVVIFPLLYFYNSTNFGFTNSPSWYNLLYQLVFIGGIIGNIITYYKKQSHLIFNIAYFVSFILIVIIISLIMYAFKKK